MFNVLFLNKIMGYDLNVQQRGNEDVSYGAPACAWGPSWDTEQTGRCCHLLKKAGRCVHRRSTRLQTEAGREASVVLGVGLKARFLVGKPLGINKNWLSKMDLATIWAFCSEPLLHIADVDPWVWVLRAVGCQASARPWRAILYSFLFCKARWELRFLDWLH